MDASPDASSPIAKITPTAGPSAATIAACAPSIVSVPSTPRSAAAASRSIAMFTAPAITRAAPTSHFVALSRVRMRTGSVETPWRSRASAECR